jgi:spore coat polysaccharide biosynthesis predicted glycosyltransferase SpsG
MKKIAIIYEKSKKIGTGHYFRSLRLRDLLEKKFIISLFHIERKKEINKILKQKFDLNILDLKTYPKFYTKKKLITFENLGKNVQNIKNIKNINPLDLHLKNSGPEFFTFPKDINKVKLLNSYNSKKRINILIIQGGNDSNSQLQKLINFLETNKKEIKFNFRLIVKVLNKNYIKCEKPNLLINNIKDINKLYKKTQIAISSVGNTSFELGYIGIPSIHFTIEKREIKRAQILERLRLAMFIKKDLFQIIDELNKIYFNNNYRKKLIKRRSGFFRKKNKLLEIVNNEI